MWEKVNTLDINPNPHWQHCQWDCKVLKNIESEFIAELWVLDDYDGYLMQWKKFKTSPTFKTEEEVRKYVLNHWHEKKFL